MNTRPSAKQRLITLALTATLIASSVLLGCGTQAPGDQTAGSAAVVKKDNDGLNGTLVDPPLRLTNVVLLDTRSNPVRINEFSPNKATALFFGFTHCDDVCPTTMADLASARRALPPALSKRVTVVFVTVDPRRDTPPVLRTWLDQFDKEIIGLRGPTNLVNKAERSLYADESTTDSKANSETDPGTGEHHHGDALDPSSKPRADYEVSHSGSVYVFGPRGETVLYSGGTTVDQYAADFTRLLGRS